LILRIVRGWWWWWKLEKVEDICIQHFMQSSEIRDHSSLPDFSSFPCVCLSLMRGFLLEQSSSHSSSDDIVQMSPHQQKILIVCCIPIFFKGVSSQLSILRQETRPWAVTSSKSFYQILLPLLICLPRQNTHWHNDYVSTYLSNTCFLFSPNILNML